MLTLFPFQERTPSHPAVCCFCFLTFCVFFLFILLLLGEVCFYLEAQISPAPPPVPGRITFCPLLVVVHTLPTALNLNDSHSHVLASECLRDKTREGKGTPLQSSCLENPMDGGAWWAAVYGVAQSRRRLKRLSSSSSPRVSTVLGT